MRTPRKRARLLGWPEGWRRPAAQRPTAQHRPSARTEPWLRVRKERGRWWWIVMAHDPEEPDTPAWLDWGSSPSWAVALVVGLAAVEQAGAGR